MGLRAFGEVATLVMHRYLWNTSWKFGMPQNSAGVIIDAIRAAKIALDRQVGGPILSASSYFMKSPPVQHHDDMAHDLVEAFIAGDIER